MRLFVSYARVDKPYCIQIVDTLDIHEIWFDQRLYAGQHWWKEILRRLDWCEGFVYLLSPDSIASEYCQKEFELALSLGRHIFPVLIRENTPIPTMLLEMQYADLSKGITPEAVKILLNSILLAERERGKQPISATQVSSISSEEIKPPTVNPATVISVAAAAMEKGQFDQAVFLLKQANENGFKSRFIKLDALLAEAVAALERQTYLREAEREYKQIIELIKHTRTRKLGLEAFWEFRKIYPDYDPDSIAKTYGDSRSTVSLNGSNGNGTHKSPSDMISDFTLPMLDWCDVPAGMVMVDEPDKDGGLQRRAFYVDSFRMSKYPVTNAQYQVFLDDASGYANVGWWAYSSHAHNWRVANPKSKPSRFSGEERPREMVNWYDALAFCYWLRAQTGLPITLPTGKQWQRAARGDDTRLYPWGDSFDKNHCNTRESELKMTTLVMRYPEGVSPFGVFDMAGNVWEWCLDGKGDEDSQLDITSNQERAVFGGSFVSVCQRSQISFHYYLNPQSFYASIGFRLIYGI
jgi:formylglycine-generating enzyme required for sulfatase activity